METVACGACQGLGHLPSSLPNPADGPCPYCGGTGYVPAPERPPACFVGRDRLPENPNQTEATPDDQEGDQDRNQDVGTRDPQGP